MLRKPNKPDYIIAKYYRIICLLNYLRKIAEKAAAEVLSKLYKRQELLYNNQFDSRKRRGVIDTITKLITTVKQA